MGSYILVNKTVYVLFDLEFSLDVSTTLPMRNDTASCEVPVLCFQEDFPVPILSTLSTAWVSRYVTRVCVCTCVLYMYEYECRYGVYSYVCVHILGTWL